MSSLGKLLRGEEFHFEGAGMLSKDCVVGIYPKGWLQRRFQGEYRETGLGSLLNKDGKIGDAKNLYDASRFGSLQDSLRGTTFRLLLNSSGNCPAIFELENAQV